MIDGALLAYPFIEGVYAGGTARSGVTYNHKKLWELVRGSRGKPYNYYPRGRVDADNRGQPVIYMSPHVSPALLPEIQAVFAITSQPLLRYDNSRHYRCHLDDGWGGEGQGGVLLYREVYDIIKLLFSSIVSKIIYLWRGNHGK